jgi:sec-independent protein translocase protein TatA
MPNFGGGELIIVLIIVVLLFGVGRVSRIGGELGSAVANFRKGLQEGAKDKNEQPQEQQNQQS